MPYLTITQSAGPLQRDAVVSDLQNMVLGGKHGRHKDWCSLCRGLNMPNPMIFPLTEHYPNKPAPVPGG